MSNTIREDVVSIGFEVENDPFAEMIAEMDELRAIVGVGVDSATDELRQMAQEAKKSAGGVDELGESAKKAGKESTQTTKTFTEMLKSVKDIAKVKIGSGLDKLKSIPNQAKSGFDKLKSSLTKIKGIKLSDIGKGLDTALGKGITAGGKLFTTLKKVAGVTFNKVTSGIGALAKGAAKVATTLGKGLVAGAGAAVAAIGGLVTASVSSFAEYEQLVGGVETLFGDSAATVKKYANDAYKTAGLSANEYMETSTSFAASLLQSVGGDTAKAAEYANMAIIDMSDNANKMGTDMESIQNAYQGFAKQNYTMLDNLKLGYGGTKEEMQRLLDDASELSGVEYDISSYADIVDAIHVVQEEMGITGTTAKEASTTISGSMSSMKSAWSNMLTALVTGGDSFDQSVANLVSSVKTFAGNIIPVVKTALSGAVSLVSELAPMIAAEIPALVTDLLPPLVTAAISLVQTLLDTISSNVGMISGVAVEVITSLTQFLLNAVPQLIIVGVQLLVALVQGISQQLPTLIPMAIQAILMLANSLISMLPTLVQVGLQLIVSLVQGLGSSLPMLITMGIQALISLVNGIVQSIPMLISTALSLIPYIVQTLIQNLPLLISGGIQLIIALAQGLIQAIPQLLAAIPQIIGALIEGLFSVDWIQVGKDLIGGVWDGVKSLFGGGKDKGAEAAGSIASGISTSSYMVENAGTSLVTDTTSSLQFDTPTLTGYGTEATTAVSSGITSGAKEATSTATSSGKSVMQGFNNGMESMRGTVLATARSIAKAAASTINKELEVKSPSRVTTATGEYTGLGFANGIQRMKAKVTQAAEGLSTAATTATTPAANSYTPSNSVSTTTNRNVTNNFNPQFNLTMNGASATDANKRKITKWVKEAITETFDSMGRTNPELCEA